MPWHMVAGDELWARYVHLLERVNDEAVCEGVHRRRDAYLNGWKDGIEEMGGPLLNGDHHYIPLFESGEMRERPLCCGSFLDWKEEKK